MPKTVKNFGKYTLICIFAFRVRVKACCQPLSQLCKFIPTFFIPLALISGNYDQTTMLAPSPNWNELSKYHETMTYQEFTTLMQKQFTPKSVSENILNYTTEFVSITGKDGKQHQIKFATVPTKPKQQKKLKDLHICLDPGHIGGDYSQIEHRHFKLPKARTIKEGDISLLIAQKLRLELEKIGSRVSLTRSTLEPVTSKRPKDFKREAIEWFMRKNNLEMPPPKPYSAKIQTELKSLQNLLFYRISDIRARAQLINNSLKPDLVLSIHLNASPWNRGPNTLVPKNNVHFIVNGTYLQNELIYQDVRHGMLVKLFSRSTYTENKVAKALAKSFAMNTKLPPFVYRGAYATNIDNNPYVWARNLLLNRIVHCPVVLLEPYVANSQVAHTRIQEAFNNIEDEKNILNEYVQSTLEGLKNAFP